MTIDLTTYRQKVKKILCEFKDLFKPTEPSFQHALIQTIHDCFHVEPIEHDALACSKIILDELWGYSLSTFIKNHVPDTVTEQKCISELLYGLYFGGIDYKKYEGCLEFLAFQILAEKMPQAVLLGGYSFDKTVRLLAFICKNPREGTFLLFKSFDARFTEVISLLKCMYYDVDLFARLVDAEKQLTEENFAKIIRTLEKHAQDATGTFYQHFQALIPKTTAVVDDMYKGLLELAHDSSDIKKQYAELKAAFSVYQAHSYSLEDFTKFTRRFGLKGYPCVIQDAFFETTSLVEKIEVFSRFVSYGTSAVLSMPQQFQIMLSYILALISHLDATIHNPQKYKEGLRYVTLTMPSFGKELEKECALASVVEASPDAMVVVFDQSSQELFAKNSRYIQALRARVMHVSKSDAYALAEKIGAKKLVATMPDGTFGYGGARNCQFLLTGIIRAACDMGKKTISEIVAMPSHELLKLFNEHVLENKEGRSLFLVDDDMYIADTVLFSAALFAHDNRHLRIGCEGYQLGRASKYNLRYWDLLTLLSAPERVVLFPVWLDHETKAGLSEYILKSRICLNLPQGNEEAHFFEAMKAHFFLKPAYHLCGSRYPDKEIPTSFFVGLDQYVEKAISYVFFLYITSYLIAPTSRYANIGLPWNVDGHSASFMNLREGFEYIADTKCQAELKAKFWTKVREFFCDELDEYGPFLESIKSLKALDVDLVCSTYSQGKRLTKVELASLQKLGDVYKKSQQDIRLFWKFGKALGEAKQPEQELDIIKTQIEKECGHPISSYPITQGLYLTALSIGKAEFSTTISSLLHNLPLS